MTLDEKVRGLRLHAIQRAAQLGNACTLSDEPLAKMPRAKCFATRDLCVAAHAAGGSSGSSTPPAIRPRRERHALRARSTSDVSAGSGRRVQSGSASHRADCPTDRLNVFR